MYLVEVVIKEIAIDDNGIGRVKNNLNYHVQSESPSAIYDKIVDVAEDFEKVSLGIK